MKYFSVSFHYPGPYQNIPLENGNTERIAEVEIELERKLKEHKIDFKHEYSWTDGSLYKFIRTNLSEKALKKQLDDILRPDYYVIELNKLACGHNPRKVGCRTIAGYFRRK